MRLNKNDIGMGDPDDVALNPGKVRGRELLSYAMDYFERSRQLTGTRAAEALWAAATLAVEAIGAYRENQKIVSMKEQWMYVIYLSISMSRPELLNWWRTALAMYLGYKEDVVPDEDIPLARKEVGGLIDFAASIIK
ncbi:hypothetical protein GCM10007981_12140 [Thermocladium modestius]|uniref:Uncharacterized protein n=1 Tax=Thermocladium modestius TaxID=62609 RepID=A0A830GVR7_9CREN|nr:hypothetical protein [Thermocladium modestius]GGP21219.1 hypothetical protein GCM10007981_12140 [Thermocladium modestius]